MLKVGGVVLTFFQLILGVPSKLTPDTINKRLGVCKVLLEESLELWPRDWSGALIRALVLGSSKADGAAEEGGGKRGIINLYNVWCFEIILTFLIKVIAIYVRFSGIGIWGPSLEWVLLKL